MVEPGQIISGFRIERRLPGGSLGFVCEATQLSLGRSVALRLLDREESGAERPAERLSTSVHHPNIVPTYEAGAWEGGSFVATRYVHGRTLAEYAADERPYASQLAELLRPISDALSTIHGAGLTHGRINERNVMVDGAGNAFLADLGLETGASVEQDRRALVDLEALASPRGRGHTRLLRAAAGGGLAVVAVVGAVAVVGEPAGAQNDPAPPIPVATEPLGSELAPGPAQTLGCGEAHSPNTPACVLVHSSATGSSVAVERAGVVRSWAVRGASGDIALQVVGKRGGDPFLRSFSPVETLANDGPHAFAANVPVEAGDRIGVLLAAGASVGTRPIAGASFRKWEGTIPFEPVERSSKRAEGELLLRVDIEPGGEPDLAQVTGRGARDVPAGDVLAELGLHLQGQRETRAQVVEVEGAIALDLVRGGTRIARIDVADADANGTLISLDGDCGFQRGLCLRWLNRGESIAVVHAYRLDRSGRQFDLVG
jgi:hypothetical protein